MKSAEIRTAFLEYFRSKDHQIVTSSPLIPWDDPTLIFVNAGMVQFKKIFLGLEKSSFSRAVTCQKCMRAGGKHSDLENVGHTARHHTFFEMLGNFSFGDYFKKDAILFGWDLLTGHFQLPKEKLYATVYEEDDEAAELWPRLTGIAENRIVRLGAKDNFWQMGDTGPCGPCSEIIIDQGSHLGCGKPGCSVGCDCDRYLELWNLVFMQYERDETGKLTPLPKPSIDTGMGLERISAVLQGKTSNFDTDLFEPIIREIASASGISYGSSGNNDTSMRVIADHMRATVFMFSEGCVPSNEGRGYVLRRIIRRASRHAKLLNMHEPCLYKFIDPVIKTVGDIYPEIVKEKNRTGKLLKIEEENFHRTIEASMNLFDDIVTKTKTDGLQIIPGEEVARLQQTDEESFHREMESHRDKSKGNSGTLKIVLPSITAKFQSGSGHTEFVGYDALQTDAVVLSITQEDNPVESLVKGEEGIVILDRTSFYGESGGQAGDTGTMVAKTALINVIDTQKPAPGLYIHKVRIEKGTIKKGDKVSCAVDEAPRKATMRNHTATHLLHKALRMVLGDHVKQSGSVVDSERLRFDFTHFSAMQDDEIRKVEDIVNDKILEDLPVRTDIMNIDEAIKSGAMALFDEKYGDTVRVVSSGDFSKELCGGTHCKATGEIGLCVIVSEGSVASGIRRIESLTGKSALDYLRQKESDLDKIKMVLKTESPQEKIEKILSDIKAMEKEIQSLKTGSSRDSIADAFREAQEINGVKVVKIKQDGLNPNELRLVADNIKDRLKSGIILVTSVNDSQAALVCMVTKDLTDRYHAGDIVKYIAQLAGGKGGGKPDMAQGGTKEIEKLDAALDSLYEIIKIRK
jgi:alanyl-tRNA synthetase